MKVKRESTCGQEDKFEIPDTEVRVPEVQKFIIIWIAMVL